MYKRASLLTGGQQAKPNKCYPKRSSQHGPIKITIMGGERIDPPLELPGNFSSRMECDYCHEFFSAKPDTPAVVLMPGYVREEFNGVLLEPVRSWRAFCSPDHQEAWIRSAEKRQTKLKDS